ncbi:MAG TPA: 7-carboxy-7-deazaguanine synthase QueE, partial [Archangium sp.]
MPVARPHIEPRRVPTADSVVVKEFYLSVQGESSHAGLLCSFVRLTG